MMVGVFMRKKNIVTLRLGWFMVLYLVCGCVTAQYDGQFSQYMLNPGTFNPASIGEGDKLTVNLTSRQQWVDIDNAPSTFLLNASMPQIFGTTHHGLGLVIMKESIGLFSTQLLQIQYAYKKPLWGGLLSVGLQGGMLQQDFDADKIYIPSSNYHSSSDVSQPKGNLSGKIPDLSAGIWLNLPRFHAGFSTSHLFETGIKLKKNEEESNVDAYTMKASRTYYLTGGYNISLPNPLYTLQPSLLLKSDLTAWQTDLSARLIIKDKYWGMMGWRPQDAVIVSAGIKLPQGLSIGYAYDISLALWGVSGGSHEIYLSYSKKIETATVSKKQKSVRIL